MKYGKILKIGKIKNANNTVFEVKIKTIMNLKPGNFISIIFPSSNEIPLGIGDYQDNILTLYIESEKLIEALSKRDHVMIKGPLGKPIKLGDKVLGIGEGNYYFDLLYPLRYASRLGKKVKVVCDNCETEFETADTIRGDWDTILASVHKQKVNQLPKEAYVYVRWVKMNCALGVCGICQIGKTLPCIEGPFIKVGELVD